MSFFPDPQRQGDIKFIFAKNWSYDFRMKFILGLLVTGILVQIFVNFGGGLLLLAWATSLSLIRGYAAKPKITGEEQWAQVTPDEFKKVKEKQAQLKKWDSDAFDITNTAGKVMFFVVGGTIFFISICVEMAGQAFLAGFIRWNGLVLLAPHWFTGIRSYLKKDSLIIKIDLLEKVIGYLSSPSDIQVLPMLSTAQTEEGKKIPMDARLMVRLLNAPKEFMGIQIQISLNDVQGTFYPYLYCVLLADSPAHLFTNYTLDIEGSVKKKTGWLGPLSMIIVEKSSSGDVDVLVVRQQTSKTSGYHTNLPVSEQIIEKSLNLARNLIKRLGS